MKKRQLVYVFAAIAGLGSGAWAQEASAPDSTDRVVASDSTTIAPHAARQSTIDRPSDAVRRSAGPAAAAPVPAATQSIGTSRAQMVVGGAAIVVGALIGGNGGSALALGGAVVGLYGLWNYLK